MKEKVTRFLVLTALFAALGILYPQVFHWLGVSGQQAGTVFLPMHIPILLCGFVCGRRFGAACGLVTPLLSSLIFGMPLIFPVAVTMAFELAAYGYLSGLAGRHFHPVLALIPAMLGGRIVLGLAQWIFYPLAAGFSFTFNEFVIAAFVTCLPGIAMQFVFVPLILFALQKAKAIDLPFYKNKSAVNESGNK